MSTQLRTDRGEGASRPQGAFHLAGASADARVPAGDVAADEPSRRERNRWGDDQGV